MDTALRALNRFGLGARPGQRRHVARDPRGWLDAQLGGPVSTPAAELPELAELGRLFQAFRRRQQAGEALGADETRALIGVAEREATTALTARIASERPFVERWVAFWSNHLCVSAERALAVRLLAGHYERSVIRPHALGRFDEMVLASARHPAMLVYLDNVRSVGPDSRGVQMQERAARRPMTGGRRRGVAGRPPPERPTRSETDRSLPGLNENYARELLELHTLGVAGGYTQDDVTELARLLTGWTVAGLAPGGRRLPGVPEAFGFAFVPLLHDTGQKTILGGEYGEGEAEGQRALRALCRHPATAHHLATKLVRHFVADDPPADAVERVAATFRDTQGDLREVARTIVDLGAAWAPEHTKFRTPQDWLVAAVRGLGGRDANAAFLPVLGQLRHPLWSPPAPSGFGDTIREWADPDSLMNRAELARTVARRVVGPPERAGRRDGPDPRPLTTVVDLPPGDPLPGLLTDLAIPLDERVALALAGPTFQWR